MALIENLVAGGLVTLLALGVLALELVLVIYWWRASALLWPAIANIASGACLIMALRAALIDTDAIQVAVWLGLGFAAHIADLAARR